jgi:hypothetical protein
MANYNYKCFLNTGSENWIFETLMTPNTEYLKEIKALGIFSIKYNYNYQI